MKELFKVRRISNGNLYRVFGFMGGSPRQCLFLVYAGNAWLWVDAHEFMPIEEE